jgi:glycerate dehydrogenase
MRIVVLDGHTLNPGDNPWTELETLGEVEVHESTPPEKVVERSRDADILVINKVKVPREVLERLPSLKMISVTATGFDCVDKDAARERGIPVCNVPVYGTDSVAQHVFAFILYFCHRVDLHGKAVQEGEWSATSDFCFWKTPLMELVGKTLGIVGFGRIGGRVGELAHAFGMEVLANTRNGSDPPGYEPFSWADLDEIAARSDFITLHCPLTPDTKGMVDREFLEKMKPTAYLLNASRGPLIVEEDLRDALNEGVIAGAAVDVVSAEPMRPDNPFLKARNCLITPHNAWATLEARQRLMATTVENVQRFIEGNPINVLNSK